MTTHVPRSHTPRIAGAMLAAATMLLPASAARAASGLAATATPVHFEQLISTWLDVGIPELVFEFTDAARRPMAVVVDAKTEFEVPELEASGLMQIEIRIAGPDGRETVLDRTRLSSRAAIVPLTAGAFEVIEGEFALRVYVYTEIEGALLESGWVRLKFLPPATGDQRDDGDDSTELGDDFVAEGTVTGGVDGGARDSAGVMFDQPVTVRADAPNALAVRRDAQSDDIFRVNTADNQVELAPGEARFRQTELVSRNWMVYETLGDESANFNWAFSWTPNLGSPRPNRVWTWGYNPSPDGGNLEMPGEPSVNWRIETFYAPAPGEEYFEPMLQYVNTSGQIFRPISWRIDRNSDVTVCNMRHDWISFNRRSDGAQYFKAEPGRVSLINNTLLVGFTPDASFIRQVNLSGSQVDLIRMVGNDVGVGQGGHGVRVRGSRLAFFDGTPVERPGIGGGLLDNTGGSASGALANVSSVDPDVNDNFARLAAEIAGIRTALLSLGLADANEP